MTVPTFYVTPQKNKEEEVVLPTANLPNLKKGVGSKNIQLVQKDVGNTGRFLRSGGFPMIRVGPPTSSSFFWRGDIKSGNRHDYLSPPGRR